MTPTLALALGVPIPFSNLGIAILDFFDDAFNRSSALKSNFEQVKQFVDKYNAIETLFDETRLLDERIEAAGVLNDSEIAIKYADLKTVQEKFREKWSTFNISYCMLGIFLLVLSILNSLVSILEILNIYEHKKVDNSSGNLHVVLVRKALVYFTFYLVFTFLSKVGLHAFSWLGLVLFNLDLLYSNRQYLLPSTFLLRAVHLFTQKEYFLFFLTCLIPFSNSFIINENVSLRFFLIAILYIEIYNQLKFFKRSDWHRVSILIVCIVLVRFSFLFHICREEVMQKCTQFIFSTQLQKASIDKVFYIFFIAFNFVSIFIVVRKLRPRDNNKLLDFIYAFQFLSIVGYNFIELEINNMESLIIESKLDKSLSSSTSSGKSYLLSLKIFNIQLARLTYALFMANIVIICTKYNSNSMGKYQNLVISLGLFMSLILGENKLSVWILIFILDSLFKQFNLNSKSIH